MMVNAIREPHPFHVHLERLELGSRAVAFKMCIYRLKQFSYPQIIFPILVEQNITSLKSRFRQIIHQYFLLKRQLIKTSHPITQYLQIGKLIYHILKRVIFHIHHYLDFTLYNKTKAVSKA